MESGAVGTMPPPKKKNIGGRPKTPNPMRSIASFKGSVEFDTWFNGLADHCRLTASALIEHALVAFAEQQGYKKAAPKR